MRVLDIDLDFFLSDVATFVPQNGKRLPSDDFHPWKERDVRQFMEDALGLQTHSKVPAIFCTHHDEVLTHCEKLIEIGLLQRPFDLVHVDSHADMGCGDNGWVEILQMASASEKVKSQIHTGYFERIGIGNYISYMALLRMLNSLKYVHNPHSTNDVFAGYLNADQTQMRIPVWPNNEDEFQAAKDCWLLSLGSMYRFERKSEVREPAIPFQRISGCEYRTDDSFDIAFLAQSPDYTPKESDLLIPILEDYLDFGIGKSRDKLPLSHDPYAHFIALP